MSRHQTLVGWCQTRVPHIDAFNELLVVGAAVAFVGAALALVLIRRRDFVGAAA
jgi:hypothetical protein